MRIEAAVTRGADTPVCIEPLELDDLRPDAVRVRIVGRSIIAVTQGDATRQNFIPLRVKSFLDGALPLGQLMSAYHFEDINAAAADSAAGRTIKPVLHMPAEH